MSINWLDNVEPKVKCWWMFMDYIKSIMEKVIDRNNKVIHGGPSSLSYTVDLYLRYNTFYDNHNLQTSFTAKLIQDGIYKFINLEYGKNAGSYAVRISFKNNITKEDIEFMIGLFALLGYTETLHNDDF